MAILAKAGESAPRELIPVGNYVARCYKMIEIGTVLEDGQYGKKFPHKIRIGWEFPHELKVFNTEKGEQPLVIDREYTLSMAEKANLRKDLKAWRGRGFTEEEAKAFDVTKLIGAPCMINVIHKPSEKDPTKVYEQITSITPLPKGMTIPAQINPTFILSYDAWDQAKYDSLPDFIKDKMKTSDEYKVMFGPKTEAVVPTTTNAAVAAFEQVGGPPQDLPPLDVDNAPDIESPLPF